METIVNEESIEEGGCVPYQADFVDMDGYAYYARFRHGKFVLKKNLEPIGLFDFRESHVILKKSYADGFVDFKELQRITAHILVWPTKPGVLKICQKQIV